MNTLVIACFLIMSLLPIGVAMADDDDDQQVKPQNSGQVGVILDSKTQSMMGVKIQVLKPAQHQLELLAYGKAVNIQPLLALRQRYLLALTEGNSTRAKFTQSEQSINRAQALYSHGVTAKRQLQDQQAQWLTSKAQVDALQVQAQAIIDEARLDWGSSLTDWALSTDVKPLNEFLSGRKVLLQVSLPAGKQLADEVGDKAVEPAGNRAQASVAKLISAAPQSDNTGQGASYFFSSADPRLKPGMRVSAWVAEQREPLSGVIVPKSALLWYLNQAFVYVKTDVNNFSRRVITNYATTADGYFVSEGLEPGEQVVVIGAQLLLSDELRGHIADDDD